MKLSIGKKNKEQLKENDDKYKKEINQKEQEFKMLQLSYHHLQTKYSELKEEYQTRTNKYELVFERMKFNDIRDKLNYNPIHLHNDFLIHNSLLDIPTNRKFQTIL